MSMYRIQGGKPLKGSIAVAGNKNAVLPEMASAILFDSPVTLTNVPQIQDVRAMKQILTHLGASVTDVDEHTVTIDASTLTRHEIPIELSAKLRASVLFLGPLFARFGKVTLPHPGGDIIGKRSIQTHLDALAGLGAKIQEDHNTYRIEKKAFGKEKIDIFLDEPSVTGTENIVMAAVLGKNTVTIRNTALEPHVLDLLRMLVAGGASVDGIGTHTITITGTDRLQALTHTICPDYLEAGTFAVLGAITKSPLTINNVPVDDLRLPLIALERMGARMNKREESVEIIPSDLVSSGRKIQAGPHPLFPTDLMSPFIVLATQSVGHTLFHDPLYESRMFFVDKLIRMGANITICDPHRVIVHGSTELVGRKLASPDIRAGIALVLAALVARGTSEIDMAEIVERGYENLDVRLRALGATIEKIA